MPVRGTGEYPAHWRDLACEVKGVAGWRCVRCGHPHDRASGHVLTVHHWTLEKSETRWWALLALCQRCHLAIQAKVNPARPWILDHSEWFRPFVAGFYAWKYLGLELTRAEVEANLDYYLSLERQAVLGQGQGALL